MKNVTFSADEELIERYALRELSDVELLQVEKHVASCPECLDRLQGEVDLAAVMRSPFMAKVRKIVKADRMMRVAYEARGLIALRPAVGTDEGRTRSCTQSWSGMTVPSGMSGM